MTGQSQGRSRKSNLIQKGKLSLQQIEGILQLSSGRAKGAMVARPDKSTLRTSSHRGDDGVKILRMIERATTIFVEEIAVTSGEELLTHETLFESRQLSTAFHSLNLQLLQGDVLTGWTRGGRWGRSEVKEVAHKRVQIEHLERGSKAACWVMGIFRTIPLFSAKCFWAFSALTKWYFTKIACRASMISRSCTWAVSEREESEGFCRPSRFVERSLGSPLGCIRSVHDTTRSRSWLRELVREEEEEEEEEESHKQHLVHSCSVSDKSIHEQGSDQWASSDLDIWKYISLSPLAREESSWGSVEQREESDRHNPTRWSWRRQGCSDLESWNQSIQSYSITL
jgi:hypothetical protein